MARIRDIVIDCIDAPALARFWAGALDGYDVRPYDDAEVARLRGLGATVRDERDGYTVMQDPEGNEFCVRDPDPLSARSES